MLAIFIICIALSIFFGFLSLKLDIKNDMIFAIPLFMVLIIIMGFVSPMVQDYSNYYFNYLYYMNSHFEYGYQWLVSIALRYGASYEQFRLVTSIAGMLIFGVAIKRLTNSLCLFLVLYSFFPFVFDVIQTRNFLMVSFVILGYSFLKVKTKKNLLVSLLLVIIGASFHNLGYFFIFPILAYYFVDYPITQRMIFLGVLIGIIFSLSSGIRMTVANFLSGGIFGSTFSNILRYIGSNRGLGFLIDWTRIIIGAGIMVYLKTQVDRKDVPETDRMRNEDINVIHLTFYLALFSLLSLPFLIDNASYERTFRCIYPMIVFCIIYVIKYRGFSIKQKALIYLAYSIVVLLNIITMLETTSSSLNPIFDMNLLTSRW